MKATRCALMVWTVLAAFAAVAGAQENAWTSHGPTGPGYVVDLAIADGVAYAATGNGVFRSNDGGATWQQSGLAADPILEVLALPGVAFVLTGVNKDQPKAFRASRDGGKTWGLVPGLPSIVAAAVDPWHFSTLYAGTVDGTIWKSSDAGASWQQISTSPTGSAAIAFEFDSRAIYVRSLDASIGSYRNYKSLDGGASWDAIQSDLEVLTGGSAPGVVYARFVTAWGEQGFCRSADSAASWTCSSILGYPYLIFEVPGEVPRILATSYVGSDYALSVSSDGGASWASTAGKLGSTVYAFASDASGSLLLAGTSAGIFRSEDRGDSWTPSSAGQRLPTTINSLALDPQNPSTVWAGTPQAGVFRSSNGGFSWSQAGGQGEVLVERTLAVDPEVSSTLYAWTTSGVSRSDDGGATWSSPSLLDRSAQGNYFRNTLAVDPGSSGRVWAADWSSGLSRSDDGARTWEPTSVAQNIFCILFDEKRPGTIYLGSYYDTDYNSISGLVGGSIFVSRDSGASFTKFTVTRDGGALRDVTSIAADPFDANVLYAGTRTGVYRSADAGRTWQAPLQPFRADALVADPVRPGQLYVTTSAGVLRTTDGAQSWHDFSAGLGSLGVGPLVVSPDGKWLHAGTSGGVFELDLEGGLSTFPCVPTATRLCLVGSRYAVDLVAARKGQTTFEPGSARPLGDRAGYFGLPAITGNSDLPEVVVKMLADGTFGHSGAPFFYSSLTTVSYRLTVTDTMTGDETVYVNNPDQPLCGQTDLLFDESEAPQSLGLEKADRGRESLQLLGGRFSVTLEARRVRDGRTASGVITASGDVYGIFSLPGITGDATFPEVAVKMVDARSFANGKFWFFHTGLTSLDYTLTVTDSVTGAVQTYTNTAPFCGAADTKAFTDGPGSAPCVTSVTRLCLVDGRYAVELAAHHREDSGYRAGMARPLGGHAGYFSFPFTTEDSDLPEIVLALDDDGTVAYSSLTTLPYFLTVTDTATGRVKVYASNPEEPLCGGTDPAFQASEAPRSAREPLPGGLTLHLLDRRFSVDLVLRRTSHPQRTGNGRVLFEGDRYGAFDLDTDLGVPGDPVVFIKMIDGRVLNGHFWLFHSGLTTLEYTLIVTDEVTGTTRFYDSKAPFCGVADTAAFADPPADVPSLAGTWRGTLTSLPEGGQTCPVTVDIQQPKTFVVEGRLRDSTCFFFVFEAQLFWSAFLLGNHRRGSFQSSDRRRVRLFRFPFRSARAQSAAHAAAAHGHDERVSMPQPSQYQRRPAGSDADSAMTVPRRTQALSSRR